MKNMKPQMGGTLARGLTAPLASHTFLNARTYVRYDGEPGIYFLREWMPKLLSLPSKWD
jgi:uncharacterized protein YqjF (DUF2071 family)